MAGSAVIGALRVNLGIDTAAFSSGLKSAQSSLKGFGTGMMKVGAAITAAGTGLAIALKSQIDSADEMSKAAAKFGVPIEQLSQLAYAGKLSDLSLDQVGTALGKLSKNMAGFGDDAKGAVKAFSDVGVSATNADGSLRPTLDVLTDLADSFAGMADGPAKTAAAMAIFGKAGADMIPLLNGGGQALRDMMQEADALGLTLTQDVGSSAENFNDNITRLQTTIGGLATQVASALVPVLSRLSDAVVNVSTWFRNLSPETQRFLAVGTALGIALGPVVVAIGAIAVGIAAIGVPVAAVIAGIIALTAAVVAFWPEIIKAKDAVVQFATDGIDFLKGKFEEVSTYLAGLRDKFIRIGSDIIDGLLAGLRQKWEDVKAWFAGLADAIPQWVRDKLGIHSPSTVFAEIGQNVMQGLARGLDSQQGEIKDGVRGFAQDIAQQLSGILQGSVSFRDALGNILGNVGGNLIDTGLSGLGKAFGVPGFANGTNFAPGGLALVGEHGPELVRMPRGASVTPNSKLWGGGLVHVEVGVRQDGNLQAYVTRTAGAVTAQGMGQVRREIPGAIENHNKRFR